MAPSPPKRPRITSLEVLCVLLVLALILQSWFSRILDVPKIRTAATVFVAVCTQALPFLVVGVLISGAIAAFVSAGALRKILPKRALFAVPMAGVAGIALPTCECAAVPVARRLIVQGAPSSVALAFLLAAPAVNPVVLVATAVAFPGEPRMVLARFAGSMGTAVVMGWLWARFGKAEWFAERAMRRLPEEDGRSRWLVFAETARHDLVGAGGFLVIGGLTSAVLNVFVRREWINTVGDHIVLGIVVMAVLAVGPLAVQRGRRVRRGVAVHPSAAAATGVPRRRPGDRHQAVQPAGRHVRPGVRDPVRAVELRRGDWLRGGRRRAHPRGCAVNELAREPLIPGDRERLDRACEGEP